MVVTLLAKFTTSPLAFSDGSSCELKNTPFCPARGTSNSNHTGTGCV